MNHNNYNPNNYLLFSFLSLALVPFTGMIALSYAFNAKTAFKEQTNPELTIKYLQLCRKWLKITVITFAIIFPILVSALVLINFLY